MVQPDLVSRKVARATAWLDDADEFLRRPRESFLADRSGRDLATFYLFLAIQECIDLAAHWVTDAELAPADDAGSSFDLLAGEALIAPELASAMRAAVGLRNRIAHGYATVDHSRLHEEAVRGTEAVRRFLLAVADRAGL